MTSATENANPAKRIQRAEIFVDTWNGVSRKLQSLYSKQSGVCERDIQVVPCGNADQVEALMQQKAMEYQLPVIAVALAQVEPNNESYNKHLMRRYGFPFRIDEGREWYTFVKATPSAVTFQATLFTDDMLTLLKMVDRWMSNETWGFKIEYDEWAANIKVVADKVLAIPPRAPGAGGSEQYKLAANLRVETYAGYAWKVPSIRAVELNSYFPQGALNTALKDGQTLEEALDEGTFSVSADGIPVISRVEMGAQDPAHEAVPYEPTF